MQGRAVSDAAGVQEALKAGASADSVDENGETVL